ncbi:MAG: hypothetical protein LUD78_04680 [Clostridiales bacterium]|nr:hypothetical protein [Clostridiales bacterium]
MDALQERIDTLGNKIEDALPEIVPAVPVFALFILGERGAASWGYALCLVCLLILVLIYNPFCVLNGFMAPKSRQFLSLGVSIGVLAVIFPWLSAYARACLLLLAAGLSALSIWKRKSWLYTWQVQQSAEVDSVLSHLSHGGDWDAGKAWDKYGCRETRALLHQALGVECPENLVNSPYRAVYYLAFLHGRKKSRTQIKKLKAKVAKQEDVIAAQKKELYTIENQDVKILELQQENGQLEYKIQNLMRENAALKNQNAKLDNHLQQIKPPIEERDSAILRYIEAGHSYAEAGTKFGLSKSGAIAAAKRAKGG